MSEQHTPPEGDEQPTLDTPQEGTEQQQEVDYEARYKEAQAWGTRTSQELAELRQREEDIDYFRQLAEKHGYQLNEQEEAGEEEFYDPTELFRQVEELKQWRAGIEEGAQHEQIQQRDVEYIGTALQGFQERTGRELTEEEIGLLGDAAWSNRDENGIPRVADVIASYESLQTQQQQRWAKTKRAPHISSNGQAGTQTKNVVDMTRQERQDWMAEQLAANEQ